MSDLEYQLGRTRLERLAARLGGTRLRVPRDLDKGNAPRTFAERVGSDDLAVALILHYADCEIYVPRLTLGGGKERVTVKLVMRLTRQGKSAREIALKLKCSMRVVYRKRARHRARERDLLERRKGGPA